MPVKACPHDGHGYCVGRCPVCQADRIKVRDWRSRRKIKSGWEWGRIREKVHRRDRVCVVCGGDDRLKNKVVHELRRGKEAGRVPGQQANARPAELVVSVVP